MMAKTCADTLSDGPNHVLSEGYSDFEPEFARKIKKAVYHLSSD
jgi:hypothetical protein